MRTEARPRFTASQLAVLAVLSSSVVVVSTGIQMGTVLFPALSRWLNVPVRTVALLASVWAFTGLVSPLFGPASDRHGHATFLLLGLGVFSLGNLLCAIAPGFAALLVFQVPVGLGYAISSFSTSAVVGDVFAYDTRARAMGLLRIAISIAALAGVPVAAALAERATARAPFAVVGGLGLAVLAVCCVVLPRVTSREGQGHRPAARATFLPTIVATVRQPSVREGLLVVLAWAAIPTGVFIYLAAWLEGAFQLGQAQVGLAFSTIGIGALVGNALTAAAADRVGKKRSALLGLFVLSLTALVLPRWPRPAGVLVGLVIFTAALEFGFAAFAALLTELAPAHRGTLMSLVSLANGVGTGAVPLLLGPMWERGGYGAVTLILGLLGLTLIAIVRLAVGERSAAASGPDQPAPA